MHPINIMKIKISKFSEWLKYLNTLIIKKLLNASKNRTKKANSLLPVLKALVAPMLPLPTFLISPYPHKFVKINPKGIDPIK